MEDSVTFRILILFIITFFSNDWCDCLQNVTLLINPAAVQRGKNVSLLCLYDLDGAPLYSVKWYRGRYEFYRFSPSEVPPTKIFVFPGIKVDVSQSNASQVVLSDVTFNLAGNISCEVTTDAPGFSTAVAVKNLMVVDLPKNGPTIAVNKSKYDPGDKLIANCSSFPSKPSAVLSFYVNNDLVSYQDTKVLPGPDSLSWSFLPVNLTLLPSHFDDHHGVLSLRCTAVISSLYQNTTELRISHRKEPIPEKVTSQSMASFRICSPMLPFSTILLLKYRLTNL
ncbi:uncharacterized protein LOC135839927 [Planococcus citri]|uniref:uncharacterized protein LOC135839927 n=1 Tax=Planococcus citri TaxID=170843 RepID=UPI0031F7994B